MLQRLYVDNYKCLVNFELFLDEVTLLLGSSGAGKTAVLDVVFGLRQVLVYGVKVAHADAFPTWTLTRWQDRDVQVFAIDVLLGGDSFSYRLELEHERRTGRAYIRREELTVQGEPLFECFEGEVQLYRDDHSKGPAFSVDESESALARVPPRPNNRRLTRFLQYMDTLTVCGLHPASFRAESTEEATLLQRDGANFADWYRHVMQEHTDLNLDSISDLREIIDGFRAIRLERVGRDARALVVAFEQYTMRFDEISDGQRALIALYSLIYMSVGEGYTLFLDEPDNYVALPEIQPWLMALSDTCGGAVQQAVLCSHHPELIDYLGGDYGILLKREASGVVTAQKPETSQIDHNLKLSEAIARGWIG